MTRKELIEAIKAKGVNIKPVGLSTAALQEMYDKLHVHTAPDHNPEPEPAPEETPDVNESELPEPEETPEETPEEKPEQPEEPEQTGSSDDSFADLAAKIEGASAPEPKAKEKKPVIEKTRKRKKKGESSPDSFRVEGYVLLLITDTAFPFALSALNNMLDKRIKVKSEDLQLSDKDFAKLEPLADQAADYMAVNLNPIAGFLLIAGFMYGNNLLIARSVNEAEGIRK